VLLRLQIGCRQKKVARALATGDLNGILLIKKRSVLFNHRGCSIHNQFPGGGAEWSFQTAGIKAWFLKVRSVKDNMLLT
jgi:hypothetical protein